MLLRFRQHFLARLVLLAFASLVCEMNFAFGMQEPSSESKPNALRIGDVKGQTKTPIPSAFDRLPLAKDSVDNEPSHEVSRILPKAAEPRNEKLFNAGAAGSRLAESKDSSESFDSEDDLESVYFDQMELALSIATASMSHVSPFMWWMAGPTSNLFVDKTIKTALEDQVAVELDEVDLNEPKKMLPVDTIDFSNLGVQETDSIVEVDSKETGKSLTEAKATPRTVRIPFEEKDDFADVDAKAIATPGPLSRDRDSQRDQEEPKLNPRENGNGKEQQGVDALQASKPVTNRREIRIDDIKSEGIQVAPIVQSVPTDPILAKRLQRTDACLSHYLNNPESTTVRSPWAVMHALLAFGGEYELVHGQSRVNAIGWMCHNGTCRTQRIFTPTARSFTPNVGDGVQGHEGQFLAILAQSNVPLTYPIQIGTSKFTVEDLVRQEMMTCREKSELTFKLIGLSYYLDSNKQWRANDGKQWSISKLIQEELAQPIVGAACGGVHRLMGFSFSVKQRQLQGQPINGQYARAAKFVRDYIDYTWQLQNPDGSFSTSWYEGRANEPKDERKVQTTGHMLEWLMYTLPDEEVNAPRVGKTIDFLLSKIYDKREQKWPIGPRGHATRAVALYQGRIREILSNPAPNAQINSAAKPGTNTGRSRK